MISSPLVSICVPTFNGEQYIERAIQSIISQTYTNIEIIVSDDNSSDNTLKVIKDILSLQDIPNKIIRHSPSGIAANWNNCIRNATGAFIKFVFQDDFLEPSCVEKMVEVMLLDPKIAVVASKRHIIIEEEGKFAEAWTKNFLDLQINLPFKDECLHIIHGRDFLKADYFITNPINKIGEPVATLVRKNVFDDVGLYDENFFQLVDYEIYLRMFKKYKIAFINEYLANFRIHNEQASFKNNANKMNDIDIYHKLLFKDYFWKLHTNYRIFLFKKFHWSVSIYRMLRHGRDWNKTGVQ